MPTIKKTGEKITYSEYFKRWKQGCKDVVMNVTPIEQIKSQLKFNWFMVLGMIAGIIVCSFNFFKQWWIIIILIAGTGNILVQQVGLWQRKKMLEQFDNAIKLADKEELIKIETQDLKGGDKNAEH